MLWGEGVCVREGGHTARRRRIPPATNARIVRAYRSTVGIPGGRKSCLLLLCTILLLLRTILRCFRVIAAHCVPGRRHEE